jgi:hypothetical protein
MHILVLFIYHNKHDACELIQILKELQSFRKNITFFEYFYKIDARKFKGKYTDINYKLS